jgi:uncharacterized protein
MDTMNALFHLLQQPWPWYVAGPIIGLTVPLLLLAGNRTLGISSSLRQICAVSLPGKIAFLNYNWRAQRWNLFFCGGLIVGGFIGGVLLSNPEPETISAATVASLQQVGIGAQSGMLPKEVFSWDQLFTLRSFIMLVVGGFLVGFGTRYAGGCTSGHGIYGLAALQWPSLVAVITFFGFGILTSNFLLPLILKL